MFCVSFTVTTLRENVSASRRVVGPLYLLSKLCGVHASWAPARTIGSSTMTDAGV